MMTNLRDIDWIQGHDLGRKFKALVCHDGVFSTLNQWATEELFFAEHEFGGTIYDNRAGYEKWDPAAHTKNWATPMLVSKFPRVFNTDKIIIKLYHRSSIASSITEFLLAKVSPCSTFYRQREFLASCLYSQMRTT